MVMRLGAQIVYPVLPAHALRFHLAFHRTARMGIPVEPLCGEPIRFGIGARRVPAAEWSSLHDSLRCQRCVRSFEIRGGTDDTAAERGRSSRPDRSQP